MVANLVRVSVWMGVMLVLSEAKVVWEVQNQISEYGEDLELNCIADDYNLSSQTSKRWYQGQTLLTFNYGSEDNTKYNASLNSNGFKLIIKNLTKNDVNITYMCSDGFDKSENLPLLIADVFKDLHNVTVHTGMIIESDSSIAVIVGIVCGITIICIVIFVFVIVIRRNKDKILTKICYDIQSRVGEEEISLPTIQHDISDNRQTNRNQFSVQSRVGEEEIPLPTIQHDISDNHQTNRNQFSVQSRVGEEEEISLPTIQQDISDNHQTRRNQFSVQSRVGEEEIPLPTIQHDISDNRQTNRNQFSDIETATNEDNIIDFRPVQGVLQCILHNSQSNQEEDFISSGKFPAYSKKRVREQSFTEWSLSEPSKQKMASAGFFYKGCNTYAQCFCCGFNQKWRENDDPLSSSLHYDNCLYSEKVNDSSAQDRNPRSPDNEETNPKSME